jgi:hypothetical protein
LREAAAPDFVRTVRDVLTHLYDPVYLQTHPLAGVLGSSAGSAGMGSVEGNAADHAQAGRGLRRCLLGAIMRLRPEHKAGESHGAAAAWRTYRLL